MNEIMTYLNCFDELITWNKKMVEAVGDCPNLEAGIIPDNPFWKTVAEKGEYECQIGLCSGKARVVRQGSIRVANGSKAVMMEKMNRLASDEFIREGDILGVSRCGLYEHYAVYIGDGKVIHYSGEIKDLKGKISIHEAPFSEFLKDSKTFFVVWFDDGKPVKLQRSTSFLFNSAFDYYDGAFRRRKRKVYSAAETIKRARSRLNEEKYDPIFNNCEHFAMWCKTGTAESSQVRFLRSYVAAYAPELLSA